LQLQSVAAFIFVSIGERHLFFAIGLTILDILFQLRLVGPCIMLPETFGIIDCKPTYGFNLFHRPAILTTHTLPCVETTVHPSENIQQILKSLAKPIINLGFLTEPKEGDRSPLDATFAGDFHKVSEDCRSR